MLCVLALACASAHARSTMTFPALDRPAMAVRAPERAVLLGAARAGKRVVAVGERGIICLSDDGARSWRQARAVPVSVTLTAVQFVDDKLGWAIGHGGVVLHTQDGGETWERQADGRSLAKAAHTMQPSTEMQALIDDGPDKPLLDLHFVDAKRGFVVGAYNLAFETRDGGASWTSLMDRLDNSRGSHLYSIAMRGDAIFIAGEQGTLFRSTNSGASFTPLSSGYQGSWFKVLTSPVGIVVAGLRGNSMLSRDDGNTWVAIEGAPQVSFVGGTVLPDGRVLLVNQAGQLMISTNGGAYSAVETQPLPQPSNVISIADGLLTVGLTGATVLPRPGAPRK